MPSAKTLRVHLLQRAQNVQQLLLKDVVPGSKIAIALDCWTSPTRIPFLGVTAYFIDSNWTLREALIGFEVLSGVHSGRQLAKVLLDLLETYNIEKDVSTFTTDNASNNKTLGEEINTVAELAQSGGPDQMFVNKITRIPCLAHVIQLSLQALLGEIRINPTNEELILNWTSQDEHELSREALVTTDNIPWTIAKVS